MSEKDRQESVDEPNFGKKRGFHHGDLENALLAAAVELITERQGPYFTLRDLAKLTGVKHPAVYRHFRDKAEILTRLAVHAYQTLADYQARTRSRKGDDPLLVLLSMSRSYIDFAVENPGLFRVISDLTLQDLPDDADLATAQSTVWSRLKWAVKACQAAGLISNDTPGLIAGVMWTNRHGLAHVLIARDVGWAEEEGVSIEALIDGVIRGGIRAFATPTGLERLSKL